MNILAVHPLYPGNKEIVYLPLGLGYITAVAEREGHDVTVFDIHNLRLSYSALEITLNYTRADAVSNGEAENVVPALLQAIQDRRPHEDNPGFVYRRGEEIIKRARAAAPENLDALPYPAYHLFDVEHISRHSYNGRGERSIHIMT